MLDNMIAVEKAGVMAQQHEMAEPAANAKATQHVRVLFALVVLGVLANWLWEVAWAVVAAAAKGTQYRLPTGDEMVSAVIVVLARSFIAFVAAALTFTTVYSAVNKPSTDTIVIPFIAFQQGFFWQAAFATIQQQFAAATT